MKPDTSTPVDILPESINQWKKAEDHTYNENNLFDYIDGGAELYRSFGFKKVKSRKYTADRQPDLIIDLFDMNSSRDAYGVFLFSIESANYSMGQGAQYSDGFMLFWMDHYFVSILAYPETPESKEALLKGAKTIESNIGHKGELPRILSYLPEKSLDSQSIRYFHHYAWLNTHYYIANENILNIDQTTDALLAKYGDPSHRLILLMVEYEDQESAKKAFDSFTKAYLPELKDQQMILVEDGTFTGARLTDSLITIVFNAPSGEAGMDLLLAAKNRYLKYKS